jgi:hypothetical protein
MERACPPRHNFYVFRLLSSLEFTGIAAAPVAALLVRWQESYGDLNLFCYRMGYQALAEVTPACALRLRSAWSNSLGTSSTPSPTSAD